MPLKKILRHECKRPKTLSSLLVRRSMRFGKKAKKKRSAASFAHYSAQGPQIPLPLSVGDGYDAKVAAQCRTKQLALGAPFLRAAAITARTGKVPETLVWTRPLQVGDFRKMYRSKAFICVQRLHTRTRMQVLKFVPYEPNGKPCPHHGDTHTGPCWRVVRKNFKPVVLSMSRHPGMRGGPELYPRVTTSQTTCSLARRCFGRAQQQAPAANLCELPEVASFLDTDQAGASCCYIFYIMLYGSLPGTFSERFERKAGMTCNANISSQDMPSPGRKLTQSSHKPCTKSFTMWPH